MFKKENRKTINYNNILFGYKYIKYIFIYTLTPCESQEPEPQC